MKLIKYLIAALLLPSIAIAECAWVDFASTSNIIRLKIINTSTGNGYTGLTSGSANLRIAAIADNAASTTAYTQAGATIESITTLGTYAAPTATKVRFKEVDATNHPGIYELQFSNATFSPSSAKSLLISAGGVASMQEVDCSVRLLDSATTLWSAFAAASVSTPVTTTGGSGGSSTFRRW